MSDIQAIRDRVRDKTELVDRLQNEIQDLKKSIRELEEIEQEAHFLKPVPGDFWHDCFSPVLIVLEVGEDSVVICDKTIAVYEPPDQTMLLRSYENPVDPEVKEYFARPRKDIGYTFDLKSAKRVSRSDFEVMLKCYGGGMKDKLTYRCSVGGAGKFLDYWDSIKNID